MKYLSYYIISRKAREAENIRDEGINVFANNVAVA